MVDDERVNFLPRPTGKEEDTNFEKLGQTVPKGDQHWE